MVEHRASTPAKNYRDEIDKVPHLNSSTCASVASYMIQSLWNHGRRQRVAADRPITELG
jgi:hypothetical protein